MATGLLEVSGTFDLNLLWPAGTSDADTSKIKLDVGADPFRFRRAPGDQLLITHAFDNAEIIGKTRSTPVDKSGRVTIRFQGIDAPELHYRPSALLKTSEQTKKQHKLYLKWNLDYRQHYGETATVALRDLLLTAGQNPLPCRAVTSVDSPDDVFDTYGRFVGDVLVTINGTEVNLNRWVLSNGWAVPTFYSSMSADEILVLTQIGAEARAAKRGIWKDYSKKIVPFEWDLEFRGKGADPDPDADRGRVMIPKLFRRQAGFEVNKRSKMASGSFVKFLQQQKDDLHLADEFLSQGPSAAPIRFFHEFIVDNQLKADPATLIFREKASRLRNKDGSPVVW